MAASSPHAASLAASQADDVMRTDVTSGSEVTFIIPVRNDAEALKRCISSIQASSEGIRHEIIVIDNGSLDGSDEVGRQFGCRVVSAPRLRVSEMRNLGAQFAVSPILAFVDADHEIASGWTAAAIETFKTHSIGAAGYPYLPPPRATWVQQLYDGLRTRPRRLEHTNWVGSGNLIVRALLFRQVGGFDTSLVACEDVDLCIRLRASGLSLVASPGLKSVHHGDPATLGQLFKSELWRGQDNLRVSLRERVTARSLPSVVIPIVGLTSMVVLPIATILGNVPGAVVAAVGLTAPAAVRAALIGRRVDATGLLGHLRSFAVAMAYDMGRSLALLIRVGHRRSRVPRTR